ncbi:SGNH/GDSL hydrolase family protein [Rhizobium sp. TH2]|uniref:SGNH/GDSL hydrolase family protein n=1 Tax=Rhizobium sp. TH2 TaxID=2775403 RepID=UPI0021587782|nr:SGNH/GDSL hydrolase family protein [Rhizobium sp. TH2]UVC09206.1 SGNH/GDSL hydrolase family protein [Rhizobium sp. TH2]
MTGKKRILCFGDSLIWGWMPIAEVVPTTRYPFAERWTGVLATHLGDNFEIIEEGLSGRTTDLDDPTDPRLNGSTYLPSALATHLPLDLVILLLGTNDTKTYFNRSAYDITVGMSKLLVQVATSAGGVGTVYPAPGMLLMSPPPLADMTDPWLQLTFEGAQAKSRELSRHYAALAQFFKVDFLDAGAVIATGGIDGIHLTAQNNADLGKAVARKVQAMFGHN